MHSHVFAQRHFGAKVLLVRTERACARPWLAVPGAGVEMMVTEIVPGGDDQFLSYYTYLDELRRAAVSL